MRANWKNKLREDLSKIEDKMYYIGEGLSLNKEEYIEYMIKLEGRARKNGKYRQ